MEYKGFKIKIKKISTGYRFVAVGSHGSTTGFGHKDRETAIHEAEKAVDRSPDIFDVDCQ